MMEAKACVQLIDGAGAFQSIDDFAARTRLMDKGPSGYQIVAIMGPQSSGKSTLMNHCVSSQDSCHSQLSILTDCFTLAVWDIICDDGCRVWEEPDYKGERSDRSCNRPILTLCSPI